MPTCTPHVSGDSKHKGGGWGAQLEFLEWWQLTEGRCFPKEAGILHKHASWAMEIVYSCLVTFLEQVMGVVKRPKNLEGDHDPSLPHVMLQTSLWCQGTRHRFKYVNVCLNRVNRGVLGAFQIERTVCGKIFNSPPKCPSLHCDLNGIRLLIPPELSSQGPLICERFDPNWYVCTFQHLEMIDRVCIKLILNCNESY